MRVDDVRSIYALGRQTQNHEYGIPADSKRELFADFDRWLNAQLADAWDGGYADGRFNGDPFIKNPYRKAH